MLDVAHVARLTLRRVGVTVSARLRTVERRFPLLVVGFSGPLLREDVMARQIEEMLLLTCLGGFVAGITYAVTYAVTLLH